MKPRKYFRTVPKKYYHVIYFLGITILILMHITISDAPAEATSTLNTDLAINAYADTQISRITHNSVSTTVSCNEEFNSAVRNNTLVLTTKIQCYPSLSTLVSLFEVTTDADAEHRSKSVKDTAHDTNFLLTSPLVFQCEQGKSYHIQAAVTITATVGEGSNATTLNMGKTYDPQPWDGVTC